MRAELDGRGETLARRVVDAHALGVPILVVVGGREVERGAMTLRERDGARRELPLEAGVAEVARACLPPLTA